MPQLYDHLLDKMVDVLIKTGASTDVIDGFKQYVDNQGGEEVFLSKLPQIDFTQMPDSVKQSVSDAYGSLKKYNNTEYINKFLRVMIKIGGKSLLPIIKRWEYNIGEPFIDRLLLAGVEPSFAVSVFVEEVVSADYKLKMNFRVYMNKLFEKYEPAFDEAFKMSVINAKILIAAYLVQRAPNKYKGLVKWFVQVMKNSLKTMLQGCSISDDDIEEIKKYINGGLFITDKIIYGVRSRINPAGIAKYILRLLTGTSYMILEQSEEAKRFIKSAILLNSRETLNALYDFISGTDKLSRLEDVFNSTKLPLELYIGWLGQKGIGENYTYGSVDDKVFKDILKKFVKENTVDYKKAIELDGGVAGVYLSRLLWENGEGHEFIAAAEEKFIDEFSKFMDELGIQKKVYNEFTAYFKGEKEFEDISVLIENASKGKNGYSFRRSHLEILFWIKDRSPLFKRAVRFLAYFDDVDALRSTFSVYQSKYQKSGDFDGFIEILWASGAGMDVIVPFAGYYASMYQSNNKTARDADRMLKKLVEENRGEVLENLKNCVVEARCHILEELFKADRDENISILIDYMDDTSKVVKEKISELLGNFREAFDRVVPLLGAKKQAVRETAVSILLKWNDEESINELKNALENEKSQKIRDIIMKGLKIQESTGNNEDENIIEYSRKILKGNRKNVLGWLDYDSLPKVRLKDSSEVEDDIVKSLIISYASNINIAISPEGKKISQCLDEEDLKELSLEMLNRWLNQGAESKKKWVLAFSAVYGDSRVINILKKNIEDWPEKARGAIAGEAVRALALNGSDEALLIVDSITRKFKFKQVKEAAAAALDFAAEQLGIGREELSDRIIPTLGFDKIGERIFDYGERSFTARLTPELSIEIFDENDKKIKNLPSPGKRDDEAKSSMAYEEFKLLKKQLKNTAKIQLIRLEMALSENRKWKSEAWRKLFVENPIMHQFAIGLIWGTYENDSLVDTFRYMEDGTFNTKDEEECELKEDSLIGLVHPVELDEDERLLWKEQLENYEITQPFEQIARPVYRLKEEEKQAKDIERFGGTIINGLSLLGKLTGFGWYRGSVQDGGMFDTFYRENKSLDTGVQLSFSGVGVGYEDEEVTIYELTFYKAGTVQRGSYIYDTVKQKDLIKPSEVPERFLSEVLYQIEKALSSKTGKVENWKKR